MSVQEQIVGSEVDWLKGFGRYKTWWEECPFRRISLQLRWNYCQRNSSWWLLKYDINMHFENAICLLLAVWAYLNLQDPACSADDFISLLAITLYNFFLTNWKQVGVKLFSHVTYFQSETWESLSSNDTFLAVFKQSVFPFINLKHWKDLL